MYIRKQTLQEIGKSTLLQTLFPESTYFDLLLFDVYERLQKNPSLMRETILASGYKSPVIVEGLKSFAEEYQVKQLILVSTDPYTRQVGNITLMPWNLFLDKLWGGEIIS